MAASIAGDPGLNYYEAPGEVSDRTDVEQLTFTYYGKWARLAAVCPKRGDVWAVTTPSSPTPVNYTVTGANVTKGEDGIMGTMVVRCSDGSNGSLADGATALFEQIEVDFVETRQPLEHHPAFLEWVQESAIDDTMKAWLKFKDSPLSVRLSNQYLENPNDPDSAITNLPSTVQGFATLYNRGITEYLVFLPVVRRIREYKGRPLNLGGVLAKKENPPIDVSSPDGYSEWLKTGDKAVFDSRTGRWTRTELWTCAAEWPDVLYGGGGGT